MTAERWHADGQVAFRKSEGYPHGVMQVTGAGAILKDTTFGNGTIEYDINEDGDEEAEEKDGDEKKDEDEKEESSGGDDDEAEKPKRKSRGKR